LIESARARVKRDNEFFDRFSICDDNEKAKKK